MLYYLLHFLLGALVLVQSLSSIATASELKYEASVESLQNYSCPQWFRDAKFGIYLHWGAYSVAEQGEWYARNLYIEGRPEYKHHLLSLIHI